MKAVAEKRIIASKKGEATFISNGFCNWKDAKVGFKRHKESAHHREAIEAIVTLPKTTKDIGELLDLGHISKKAENQKMLLTILSNLRFHGRQAIPLRGDGDDTNSNFQQLLRLRAEDNPKINEWLQRKTDTYTSPEIQNEMLKVMSLQMLREISQDIQSA